MLLSANRLVTALVSTTLFISAAIAKDVAQEQIILGHPNPTVHALDAKADAVRASLTQSKIIPEVLDDFTPSFLLSLEYTSVHKLVELGNTLPVANISSTPTIHVLPLTPLSPTLTKKTYTVVMTDPDATSSANPTKSEFCHWIVGGVSVGGNDVDEEPEVKELKSYYAPAPPAKTGPHRYIFVLLSCAEGDGCEDVSVPEERPHWGYGEERTGVRKWAGENGLKVEGANWFYTEHESASFDGLSGGDPVVLIYDL